ncbi:hypothetical protein SAMN05216403_1277 [Nitrosospira multiformis ATCC 25196]|uniref:Uncharacterized protein n=1 Tax=Nitrosospira multiformis (strain ATCC 25196 / NCIMB 11849 / C 71) TaxID=323848 RepID=Q2Y8Z2_NITMU|nr:hypothetical protein [Nitrosospira multiformis]ABB74779.1 conserved hypothetical protein [Nitrosospira multiformis ATCC 25196]SEG07197.1 hypothetical protein SAMN05216403_1277 [Nitrosospira multiformis ATCC 25196]
MDVRRRNLMKGLVTGGTLLALGIPPRVFASAMAGSVRKFGLLLGNTPADAAFAAGVRTAYALSSNVRLNGIAESEAGLAESTGNVRFSPPRVIKLTGGLLNEYEVVAKLLEGARGVRWIAIMDDSSAAVFMELMRNAGAGLILRGSHAFSRHGAFGGSSFSRDVPELRHVWTAISPEFSAGDVLAEKLLPGYNSFSIVEDFLSSENFAARTHPRRLNKPKPGFLSYRLDGFDDIHLHCSGLSAADGCESVGWSKAGTWVPLKGQELEPDDGSTRPKPAQMQLTGWIESVGYAAMTAAIGLQSYQIPCSQRAFVHHLPPGTRPRRNIRIERFASFVIET